jgi:hypothetical protein
MKLLKYAFIALSLLATSISFASTGLLLIEQAEKARTEASKAGYEWTTTSTLIEKAKIASKNGNEKLAIELATKAINEAKSSLKQAQYADDHWQKYEPK